MNEQIDTPIEELEALIAENLQVTPSFYNNPNIVQSVVQSYTPIEAHYVPKEYGIYSSIGYFSSQNLFTNYATAAYSEIPHPHWTSFAFTSLGTQTGSR